MRACQHSHVCCFRGPTVLTNICTAAIVSSHLQGECCQLFQSSQLRALACSCVNVRHELCPKAQYQAQTSHALSNENKQFETLIVPRQP